MNQKKEIILLGGGGHCKSCIDVIEQQNKYRIIGILDMIDLKGISILGYEVIGTDSDLPKFIKTIKNYFITVGQIKSSAKRVELFSLLKSYEMQLPVVVSPHAYIAKSAKVGEGSIIMHHALVNAGAIIGRNCIINSKALIEHDAIIEDHCHISTSAIINGGVKLGKESFIGSNAVTKQYISIPEYSFIKANSLVVK
jgi:sugar O-acyltransferase (sialic acid O-acetyltransferase NeuD family)